MGVGGARRVRGEDGGMRIALRFGVRRSRGGGGLMLIFVFRFIQYFFGLVGAGGAQRVRGKDGGMG